MAKEKKEKKNKDGEEGGGGGIKKILMMVGPALAVAGGMFFFMGGAGDTAAASAETTVATLAPIEGEVVEVDTMTVNLIGEEGRYARVGFAVVLAAEADGAVVGGKIPLMRDAALTTMTEFTSEELQSPEGMEELRTALSERIVALFPAGEVLRVVLTELIVQ